MINQLAHSKLNPKEIGERTVIAKSKLPAGIMVKVSVGW